jgi:hypothetical protein
MSPRTALVGLLGAVGMVGQLAAAPPVSPLVEGREMDHVAREHHQDEFPVSRYVPAPTVSGKGVKKGQLTLSAVLWGMLLDHMTVPLGTAEMSPRDDGCEA